MAYIYLIIEKKKKKEWMLDIHIYSYVSLMIVEWQHGSSYQNHQKYDERNSNQRLMTTDNAFSNLFSKYLTHLTMLWLYESQIKQKMEYCCHIWAGVAQSSRSCLNRAQKHLSLVGDEFITSLSLLLFQWKMFKRATFLHSSISNPPK